MVLINVSVFHCKDMSLFFFAVSHHVEISHAIKIPSNFPIECIVVKLRLKWSCIII